MKNLLKEAGQLLIEINEELAEKQLNKNLNEKEIDRMEKIKTIITKIREAGIQDNDLL